MGGFYIIHIVCAAGLGAGAVVSRRGSLEPKSVLREGPSQFNTSRRYPCKNISRCIARTFALMVLSV